MKPNYENLAQNKEAVIQLHNQTACLSREEEDARKLE